MGGQINDAYPDTACVGTGLAVVIHIQIIRELIEGSTAKLEAPHFAVNISFHTFFL
jgi:hypothetical protein